MRIGVIEAGRIGGNSGLITEAGFTPFDVGGLADGAVMEAPRRPRAVYGEEFSQTGARRFFDGQRSAR
jgi:hypothetical protein